MKIVPVLTSCCLALALAPPFVHAENLTATEGVNLFLADPELGVVGRYSAGGESVYFEARSGVAKAGESALSARLLDAHGRTIAVLGRTMDESWLVDQSFDAAAAKSSQKLALALAVDLPSMLADPAFVAERAVLVSLATGAAAADLSLEYNVKSLSKALPVAPSAAIADFYARAAGEFALGLDKNGQMVGNFRGITLQATQQAVPRDPNEAGSGPRIETYTRLTSKSGSTIAAEFGGDLEQDGWAPEIAVDESKAEPTNSLNDLGSAVMAAQALTKMSVNGYVALANPAIVESFGRLASGLRDNLLPRTANLRAATEKAWSPTNNKTNDGQIWTSNIFTSPLGEHSAFRSTHRTWTSSSSSYLSATYNWCNHGSCPYSNSTRVKCTYLGAHTRSWRYAAKCTTGYSLTSWWGHNCHDDSWTELRKVKGYAYYPTSARCNDAAFYAWAPNCSD